VPGRILQMSVKPKTPGERGLPKRAVTRLEIQATGVTGDFNHYRAVQLPGDLDQAVLVLTEEVLATLGAEGWPVRPGDLGENLTLADIPEAALGPGVRLRLGEVVLEISLACDPCTVLYALPYVGSGRGPEFIRALHGRRGWYARVLHSGSVAPTTPVDVLATAGALP
jgi:MOSC domain-containing protein YiiM